MNSQNEKQRFLTLCWRMAKRRTARQKRKTLLQLTAMLAALGYPVHCEQRQSLPPGRMLIAGDIRTARWVIAADFNLRGGWWIRGRQQLMNQTENRRRQGINILAGMLISMSLALFGALAGNAAFHGASWPAALLSAALFLAALTARFLPTAGNAGKNAALFALLECARLYRNENAAFCLLEENGAETGLAQLAERGPQLCPIYLNQLGREAGGLLLFKGQAADAMGKIVGEPGWIVRTAQAEEDSLIRRWQHGVLISTADPATLSCALPGGKGDNEVDCEQICQAVRLIGCLIRSPLPMNHQKKEEENDAGNFTD